VQRQAALGGACGSLASIVRQEDVLEEESSESSESSRVDWRARQSRVSQFQKPNSDICVLSIRKSSCNSLRECTSNDFPLERCVGVHRVQKLLYSRSRDAIIVLQRRNKPSQMLTCDRAEVHIVCL